ncbi:MAG: family 20 glycosylhydrolase [Candidatus Onthovivens sp.]|nr:family 20 glycosylhydrolase [Candidatus Onthovivens sp.]
MIYLDKIFIELKKDFNLKVFLDSYEFKIAKSERSELFFDKENKRFNIFYKSNNELFRLLLETEHYDFNNNFEIKINSSFKDLSIMVDVARNYPLKVETFKKLIRYMALLGYSTLKIYLEDLLEVNNEPYFGYLRGRYSKEEIKEIVNYADLFKIEVMPYIQTLAHLNQIKRWCVYRDHFDIDDILLVDDERTYTLIDNMLETISESFTSKRINIGMDEAYLLGRGKYLDKNGYEKRVNIFKKHLSKVLTLTSKYNLDVEMWGDMFFNNSSYAYDNLSVQDLNKVNNLKLVYWDYEYKDVKEFQSLIKLHKKVSDKVSTAGGSWKWLGLAPNNKYAIAANINFMKASLKENIEEYTLTCWGDNGSSASIFSILPTLFAVANFSFYQGNKKIDYLFKDIFKISFNDFLYVDKVNNVTINDPLNAKNNISRIYLYNDLLLGTYNSLIDKDQISTYKVIKKKLNKLSKNNSFNYIFKTLFEFCRVLILKVEIMDELRIAYQDNNKEKLNEILIKLNKLRTTFDKFYFALYEQYHLEAKGNGFDVIDIRLGGVLQRIKTTIRKLNDYLKYGTKIDELEEIMLDFYGNVYSYFHPNDIVDNSYIKISSINVNW